LASVIALDASVLIAHLDERDALHERAVECLLETADQPLVCSPITLAEVFLGPARHGRLGAARDAVAELGVHEIALSEDSAARLASMRADTGLKLPDCCVLLAAQDGRADGVLTFDNRLARAAAALGFSPR
jgi:predicted nucleic acid-binding protein